MLNVKFKDGKLIIRHKNLILQHHKVHDVHIMPGVTFIDILYRTLRIKNELPTENIVVRDLLFFEPLVTTPEFDRELTVHFETYGEQIKVSFESKAITSDFSLGFPQKHAEAFLNFENFLTHEPCNIHSLIDRKEN